MKIYICLLLHTIITIIVNFNMASIVPVPVLTVGQVVLVTPVMRCSAFSTAQIAGDVANGIITNVMNREVRIDQPLTFRMCECGRHGSEPMTTDPNSVMPIKWAAANNVDATGWVIVALVGYED